MNDERKPVKWPDIISKISISGYKTAYVTHQLNISRQYLYQMLNGKRYLPDSVKKRLETLFDCEFERPEPPEIILPHEQNELDKKQVSELWGRKNNV